MCVSKLWLSRSTLCSLTLEISLAAVVCPVVGFETQAAGWLGVYMKIMPLWLKFGWVSARSSVAISIRRRYLLITDLVLGLPHSLPPSLMYMWEGGLGLYFTLVFLQSLQYTRLWLVQFNKPQDLNFTGCNPV